MPVSKSDPAMVAIEREMEVRKATVPDSLIERLSLIDKGIAAGANAKARAQALACVRAHPGEVVLNICGFVEPLLELLDPSGNEVVRAVLRQEYEKYLKDQGYAQAPSLEKLLIQRIAICRMQLAFYELQYANKLKSGMSLSSSMHDQKRIDMAHRRYVSSIKSLAQVRRLKLPAVQVNIGEKQINVAG